MKLDFNRSSIVTTTASERRKVHPLWIQLALHLRKKSSRFVMSQRESHGIGDSMGSQSVLFDSMAADWLYLLLKHVGGATARG